MKTQLIITLFIFILTSCTTPKIRKKKLIETESERASRYYREMREKNWDNYKKGRSPRKKAFKRLTPRPYKKRKVVKKIISYTPDQIKEFQIEADQILSFHCMMKRKSKKFNDRNDCLAFAKDKLLKCKQQNDNELTPKTIRCLKKSLRVN